MDYGKNIYQLVFPISSLTYGLDDFQSITLSFMDSYL